MKNTYFFSLFIVIATLFSSCYVQQPKHSSIEKVVNLTIGINQDSVNSILGCPPHDLIAKDTSGTSVVLYKYRVKEVKRMPLLMRKNKGVKVDGKWKDLVVTFSNEGKVVSYETLPEELVTDYKKKSIDPNKLIQSITTAITVLLPAVLVYFSVK
ncbi:MAG: hypothetical protein ACPGSO_00975 [Vicingaceae bacterium]